MTERLPENTVELVAGDCDASQVQAEYGRLQDLVERANPEGAVTLELSGTPATAFALQLLLATAKSLDRRGALSGFGPLAKTALAQNA